MRIIGGKFRGRKIEQPPFETVRPTKDRVREAVFNMIAANIPGASVLDLFAGSGAYGFEALSRGADKVMFMEKDTRCLDIIQTTASRLGVEPDIEIISGDIAARPDGLNEIPAGFDIIFVDPPYNRGLVKKTLIMINHYDILNHSGLVIIEHHKSKNIPEYEGNVSIYKQKTYGDTIISVYLKK